VAVEAVVHTREVATVYNLEVGEYHTYFVGAPEWRFSVWAHNGDCSAELRVTETNARKRLERALGGERPGFVSHHVVPFSLRDEEVIQRAARGGFNINGRDNGFWLDYLRIHRQGDTHPRYTRELRDTLRLLDVAGKGEEEVAIVVQRLVTDLTVGLRTLDKPIGQIGLRELLENPRRWLPPWLLG
jgi:hypothetical protein